MKGFTIPLLSIIFVALIAVSIQSISADEPVDNKVISEDVTIANWTILREIN